MIRWVIIASFLIPVWLQGQEGPAELSKRLVEKCKTEKEKVTVLFRWVADNISYRTRSKSKPFFSGKHLDKPVSKETDISILNDNKPLKPLNERVAENVLSSKLAVCDGYTRLLKTLCDYAGVRCEIIWGYARTGYGKSKSRFGVNHYWNAVWYDSAWHLVDVTWASGYITRAGDEFVREFDSRYFLNTPEQFIKDHYPDDPRWTLLPDDDVPDEFRYSPYKQRAFSKYTITSIFPEKGIIEANEGDTIRLKIECKQEAGRTISPDVNADTTLFSQSKVSVFLKPDGAGSKKDGKQVFQYSYIAANRNIRWLYLFYNDDLLLRYKLNVREKSKN